ncbi:MAG: hypothetical protein IT384_18310 [Deltaproteobacteria bacterium]|nr:hypothetical protein [Deltaproteobacteria bacterium]
MSRGGRDLHPIAAHAAAALTQPDPAVEELGILRGALLALAESIDLQWAIESLATVARRFEEARLPKAAAAVMELAAAGAPALRLQTSERARGGIGHALRRIAEVTGSTRRALTKKSPSDRGQPARTLKEIAALPRRA